MSDRQAHNVHHVDDDRLSNNNGDSPPPQHNSNRFNRVMCSRQAQTVYCERVEDVGNNNEEYLEDLYITPEAKAVDPVGKVRYQEDGKLIYLGEGKSVEKRFWDFLKVRGDWIFLREVTELICGKRNLVNACLKPRKTSVRIEGRSPRKMICPRKYKLIRELFLDYCDGKHYDTDRKNRMLKRVNRHIGYKIKDLRTSMCVRSH